MSGNTLSPCRLRTPFTGMSRLTRLAAVRVSKKTTLARRVGCASCVQKSWRRVTAPSVLGQTQRVVQHFSVIGLAYYLQTWFRFNLQEWITRRSRELESKEGVYSLEAWNESRALYGGENGACDPYLEQVVNAEGDYRNDHGTSLSADIAMMSKPRRQPAYARMGKADRRSALCGSGNQ
jgi:hypothetical protein